MTVPRDLRCEHVDYPLLAPGDAPRFSWTIDNNRRGVTQSAFRIEVREAIAHIREPSEEILETYPVVWDSGKVPSDHMCLVPYGGDPLKAGGLYVWRVQTWDDADAESPLSAPAHFAVEIGELEAAWIQKPAHVTYQSPVGRAKGEPIEAHAVYMRREFTLAERPVRAVAYICGLGCYELSVNGGRVGDSLLDPGQTDYSRFALYQAYDVTELVDLTTTVGVILGNGRYIHAYDYEFPKLICEFHVTFADGRQEVLASDESWRASHGPIRENGIFYGERYDARLEAAGWDAPGFSVEGWEPVTIVDGPQLLPGRLQPIRGTETVRAVRMYRSPDDTYVYDFGQNMSGIVRLRVRGAEGTEVRVRHAELLQEDGRLNRTTNRTAEATVAYVCAGGGWEEYQPHFTYQGFRYAEVVGYPGVPNLESLEATFVHSDVPKIGTFACSSDLLNRVHRNVIWGQLSNLMSIPTDCPQRDERMGWLGDAQLTAEEACFNFDMSLFYAKYLNDIDAAQKTDGSVSDVVPPYWSLYPADPAWGTALLILAWSVYWFYGDERVLEEHYEAMQRYVGFLASRADGHILRDLGKYGDWCPPGSILPKRTPMALVSTWYYYHDTMLLKRIAEVLRDSSEVTALEEQARQIKAAFNREFLGDHGYAINKMSPRDNSPSQTSNLLPLALDLVPDEHRAGVMGRLLYSVEHDYDDHLDTGIVGTRYLFDVLTRIGRPELAYRIATRKSYPGWGYMLSEDATTLWERWEKLTGSGMNSHNHIMLGSVDAWYYKAVAGIEPVEAGWKRIRFAPNPVGDLTWASAWVDTVRGRAAVSWEISRDPNTEQMRVSVEVPAGATGEVVLPAGSGATLVEGSTVLSDTGDVAGVTSVEHDGNAFHLHVESGAYYFVTSTSHTA